MNHFLQSRKIGFLGAGNMAQAIIRGLIAQKMPPQNIFVSNRSAGKPQKLHEQYGVTIATSNEHLIESSDIVVIAVKPQDLLPAMEPVAQFFIPQQIVLSLAAGVRMKTLERILPNTRLARLMPNTPSLLGRGVIAYLMNQHDDTGLKSTIEDLFSTLGQIVPVGTEEQLEAFTVASSSGVGFIFELMMYWQDWIIEHDFDPETAKSITVETFLGAALLAADAKQVALEELQNRVASRKGVTAAGLGSMRELEIERALRISFEKAALRNSEIAREMK